MALLLWAQRYSCSGRNTLVQKGIACLYVTDSDDRDRLHVMYHTVRFQITSVEVVYTFDYHRIEVV